MISDPDSILLPSMVSCIIQQDYVSLVGIW